MLRENIVKVVVTVFLVAITILVLVAYVAVDNVRKSSETGLFVNNTHAIILETGAIVSSLHEGDAALRSFLITSDTRDQTAYREAYQEMVEHLTVAKALTKNEPGQAQRISVVEPLLSKRIDYTRSLVKAKTDGGFDGARRKLLEDSGGETLHDIEKAVTRLQEKEKALLRDRDKQSYLQAQMTRWTVLSGIVLNFILLGFTAFIVRDDITARKHLAKTLEDINTQLEIKVKERTAELAQANEVLRAENLERLWGNKALEHQLRYSNLIINSINDLVFVLTKVLNITRVNPAVSHLTGYDSKDIIATPLARIVRVPGTDGSAPPPQLAQAIKDGRELQDFPVVVVAKDGAQTPHRMSFFPLRDRDKVVGGVVTLRAESPRSGSAS